MRNIQTRIGILVNSCNFQRYIEIYCSVGHIDSLTKLFIDTSEDLSTKSSSQLYLQADDTVYCDKGCKMIMTRREYQINCFAYSTTKLVNCYKCEMKLVCFICKLLQYIH